MAPVLSYLAEEVSDHYQVDKKKSIHLQSFDIQGDSFAKLPFAESQEAWNLLKDVFEMTHNQEFWNTPSFVKNAPKNMLRYYIQGFVDAEGGVPKKVIVGSKIYLHITQKNIETLEFLRMALRRFNIKTGRVCLCDPRSNSYRIWITNKHGILDYIEKIGTQHPDKKKRFERIKNYLLKVQ